MTLRQKKSLLRDRDIMLVKLLADGNTVAEAANGALFTFKSAANRLEYLRTLFQCKNITHLVCEFVKNDIIKL